MVSLNEEKFGRLHSAIEWSNRQLETPRKKRLEAIRQFVGYHYSDGGSLRKVPVAFLKLAIDIYVRSLAPRTPRALFTTKTAWLRPIAANFELAVNRIPDEIDLQATFRKVVTEALFSLGIVKCGLGASSALAGREKSDTFVDCVTLDNLVIDMAAESLDQIAYIGNDYWMDHEKVMESDWFPKDRKEGLKSDEYAIIGPAGEERAKSVGVNESVSLYRDKVWLRDVWLPEEQLMVTYGVRSKKILKEVEWDGPECGPYYLLGFSGVPGNLLPLAPVAIWRDLHELGNALFRKLGRGADAQKRVLGFPGGHEHDVESFQKSRDGDGCAFNGPEPKILDAGGIDPKTLAFYLQVRDLFSYFAGNLDSLGGLSPQTSTVGQDRLLGESASAQLRDMAGSVIEFARKLFRALAYYEWHDPVKRRRLEKPIPGTPFSIPVEWNRKTRRGKFEDYDLDIDVFSLQDDSPDIKLQKLGVVVQQYVLPLLPAIQQAGGTLDAQALLRLVSRYADLPELDEIVTFVQDATDAGGGAAEMPSQTTRTYERVNRPGATPQGKSDVLQRVLLGDRPQESEMAAIGRPAG